MVERMLKQDQMKGIRGELFNNGAQPIEMSNIKNIKGKNSEETKFSIILTFEL